MNADKNATHTTWIDPDDAPELTDHFFERADLYVGNKLIRRGRPKAVKTKQPLTTRYDADIIASFKTTGKGWQTRMNDALRNWLHNHPTP